MNKVLVGVAMFSLAFSHNLLARYSKPLEKKDGVYTLKVGDGGSALFYTVDTEAQLCFVSPGGGAALTHVDCSKLKNREEWREIINW